MLSASLLVGGRGESALTWFGHPKVLADLFTPNHSLLPQPFLLNHVLLVVGDCLIISEEVGPSVEGS